MTNAKRAPLRHSVPTLLIAAAMLVLGARLWLVIDRYTVNVLAQDQWDFLDPVFEGRSLWEQFTWQHGPHRQGFGFLLSRLAAGVSRWSVPAEAYLILAQLLAAAGAAVWLKRRLLGPLTPWDVMIPFAVLSLGNWEHLVIAPNSAHSVTPLLLIVLYALACTMEGERARTGALLLINFLLIFTGFGLFMGLLTPLLLGGAALKALLLRQRASAWWAAGGVVVSLGSLALFFRGYRSDPAVDCYVFPHPHLPDYGAFVSLMFARTFLLEGTPGIVLGALLAGVTAGLGLYHAYRFLRTRPARSPLHAVIAVFLLFTLLFAAATAVGRVCTGLGSAAASRYLTLMAPGLLGLYLHFTWLPANRPAVRIMRIGFALAVIGANMLIPHSYLRAMEQIRTDRSHWVRQYLERRDAASIAAAVPRQIHRDPARTRLAEKLRYLEQRGLNLFAR